MFVFLFFTDIMIFQVSFSSPVEVLFFVYCSVSANPNLSTHGAHPPLQLRGPRPPPRARRRPPRTHKDRNPHKKGGGRVRETHPRATHRRRPREPAHRRTRSEPSPPHTTNPLDAPPRQFNTSPQSISPRRNSPIMAYLSSSATLPPSPSQRRRSCRS